MIENNYAYDSNYVYAGKTAFAYKFITDGIIKENPDDNEIITEIGFEFKRNSIDESWITKIIASSTENIKLSEINDIHSTIREYPRNSIISIYMGVLPDTLYDIRGYYYKNNVKYTFNEITIKTLEDKGDYVLDEYVFAGASDGTNYQDIDDELKQYAIDYVMPQFKEAFSIINAFSTATGNITVTFYKAKDGVAGDNRNYYNLFYYNYPYFENIRSTFIHEFGHNWMNTLSGKLTKFMEFSTDVPKAYCRWIAGHNYPLISSEIYNFVDDCLCCIGFEYSNIENNE